MTASAIFESLRTQHTPGIHATYIHRHPHVPARRARTPAQERTRTQLRCKRGETSTQSINCAVVQLTAAMCSLCAVTSELTGHAHLKPALDLGGNEVHILQQLKTGGDRQEPGNSKRQQHRKRK